MTLFESFANRAGVRSRSSDAIERLCLDIGSHTTKLLLNGKTVRRYPTCFLRHVHTNSVVSVGPQVRKMLGKLPTDVVPVFPLRVGQVVDSEGLTQFIKVLLQDYNPGGLSSFFRPPQIECALLYPQLDMQRTAIGKAVRQISYKVKFQPVSAALWQFVKAKNISTGQGCVIDIGAMTTKVYLFAENALAGSRVIEFGGDDWTTKVIQALRQDSHIEVGWTTAEELKVAAVHFGGKEHKHTVQGKDIVTGLPVTKVVNDQIFRAGSDKLFLRLIDLFEEVFQESTPELVAKILERGVYLTGGGSQLKGLAAMLQDTLKLPVTVAKYPDEDIVRGLAYKEE